MQLVENGPVEQRNDDMRACRNEIKVEPKVPMKFFLRWPQASSVRDASAQEAILAALSNRAGTAWRRHVQSLHDSGDHRNSDTLAGSLLDDALQLQCRQLDAEALARLRREPYHLFLVARTQAYDQALLDAVVHRVRRVLILGSGLDTRCYRFGAHLASTDVVVAEADQPTAIEHKKAVATRLPHANRVVYLAIDLNMPNTWAPVLEWMAQGSAPGLVIAEGVSPYIEHSAFVAILGELGRLLPRGSRIAYDFKRKGVDDAFGAGPGVTQPFRLASDAVALAAFHRELGFSECTLSTAADLMRLHVPSWTPEELPLFDEDALVNLVR